MKKNIIILIGLSVIVITSCKKKVKVAPEFKKTKWVSEDGTRTIEFTKKNVLFDEKESIDGKQVFYADVEGDGGQFWIEEKDKKSYLYDYKLSGENLFVAPEFTSGWDDPSSPKSVDAIKYKEE